MLLPPSWRLAAYCSWPPSSKGGQDELASEEETQLLEWATSWPALLPGEGSRLLPGGHQLVLSDQPYYLVAAPASLLTASSLYFHQKFHNFFLCDGFPYTYEGQEGGGIYWRLVIVEKKGMGWKLLNLEGGNVHNVLSAPEQLILWLKTRQKLLLLSTFRGIALTHYVCD